MAGKNWKIIGSVELQKGGSQSKTNHTTNGVPFPPFTRLEIATYPGDSGFYLLHLCSDGQIADTWHETLKGAFHQAEYEFGVREPEWAMA